MPQSRPDLSQLPFLIRLMDDPSPVVRDKVARVLRAFGPQLSTHLRDLQVPLSTAQKAMIARIAAVEDEEFQSAWQKWLQTARRPSGSEVQKLEWGLDLLARRQLERGPFQGENNGDARVPRLHTVLDELAEEFIGREDAPDTAPDAYDLCRWLFDPHESGGKNITGAPGDDYYNPLNSNLIWAIEHGRGLPITLVCLFMLVGDRLDLEIHGCAFPGHFLARVREDERDWLFDPFNGGRLLAQNETAALRKVAPREMSEPPTALEIVTRVLHNLINAYRQTDDELHLTGLLELLNDLHRAQPNTSAF